MLPLFSYLSPSLQSRFILLTASPRFSLTLVILPFVYLSYPLHPAFCYQVFQLAPNLQ